MADERIIAHTHALWDRLRGQMAQGLPGGPLLAGVRVCMPVIGADGLGVGTITEVWRGDDSTACTAVIDDEKGSRLQVRTLDGPLYVPYGAVAAVTPTRVTLNVAAATAQASSWRYRPSWVTPPPGGAPPIRGQDNRGRKLFGYDGGSLSNRIFGTAADDRD